MRHTLGTLILLLISSSALGQDPVPVQMAAKHRALLTDYCVKCHGSANAKGNVRLDDLSFTLSSVETAERWQKILNAVNSGDMPPEDSEQPPTALKTDFLDELANAMVQARKRLSDQGGVITMRRLNRREYKNTLRELLGVEINVSELPSDSGTGGFDTAGQNLFISANQIEQYQSLGREALEEAFAWRAAAGEERQLRYEAETSLAVIQQKYAEKLDALERAKQWVQAVESAMKRPENAAVVASLRKEFKTDDLLRRSWAKIAGAPAPEQFGFRTVENNADKANGALAYATPIGAGYMRPYHERYLKQPHLDTGAYLTIMANDLGNDVVSLYVPPSWPVGNYTVRVRIGALENAPPERRFIEFGIHPRNGQVMSTHEVTGTIAAPQIIEIPLTLTKEHSSRDNRTIFIREKGTSDHYTQTRRVFGEGKAKNGIGPELALWVDYLEIERNTGASQVAEPKPPRFGIGDNRQVGSVSAAGHRTVRYECELANEKVSKYVAEQIDARQRAQQWVKAVETAAAQPENQAVVAELKKASKNDAMFRRSWDKIAGAPSPESFGFRTVENNADKANSALGENWQKYHEYYLQQPALDRGAYLGTPTMHPAVMALGFLQLPVPNEWTSGNYVFRVRIAAAAHARPEQRFLEIGTHPRNGMVRATYEVTGTMEQPQIIEMRFSLTKSQTDSGDRTLFIREKGAWDNNEEGGRKRAEAVKRNGIGPEAVLWIDYLELERLSDAVKPEPPGLAALNLSVNDKDRAPELSEVRAALARFAQVAFRGTEPPASYLDRLTAIYGTHLKAGAKPSAALKDTLAVVLASPMFLYLAEPTTADQQRPLTGPELATRLSYFLWSAPPDERLLDLARRDELKKPEILAAETARLLDDPRARDFVQGFVYQWLGMERLDFFEVNRAKYPRFDDSTRLAAKHEVYETFAYLLRHNAPLGDLLHADYVVINHLLGDFYGIPGVHGDQFHKVRLPADSPRGGLLGMAAINVMGGNGDRTSPVERGAWVLRKLLNDPPPPAPANVPQITRLAGKVLTTRERLLAHQEDAQCASCHRKIDPIGFGLENFDAVGQWRTEDSYQVMDENGKPVKGASKTWQIDPAATLHKGPAFGSFFELRALIAAKRDDFARGFSAALIEYALGRPIGFRDEPLIADMVNCANAKQFGMREFIHTLVASPAFGTK
ncbi:MAG: DUF1592 domain-containing protein [Planctomycetaceae bacterium]|nr:DUF1592 domain-containing protein [Planctomycetaceae bacterium]